jgi:glycosyltransferase involved in cell wall biosynthesis
MIENTNNQLASKITRPKPISEQHWPADTRPVVTIFCITYNHAKFISDAINGFLKQETTFPVTIFIHDDASTDGAYEIIQQYVDRYPRLFSAVLQKENQWSRGNRAIIFEYLLRRATPFIALCEGDDRWTNPHKLQIQYDYLEKNLDCAGCFHQTSQIDSDNKVIQDNTLTISGDKFYLLDCIESLNSAYATCSLMFRAETLQNPPQWLWRDPCDMLLELQIARSGALGFIDHNMADYRIHPSGIWSSLNPVMHVFHAMHRLQLLLDCPDFKEFYPIIQQRIAVLSTRLITTEEAARRIKADRTARLPWNRLRKNVQRVLCR